MVEEVTTTITTIGIRGFTAGTYQLDIFGLEWAEICAQDGQMGFSPNLEGKYYYIY